MITANLKHCKEAEKMSSAARHNMNCHHGAATTKGILSPIVKSLLLLCVLTVSFATKAQTTLFDSPFKSDFNNSEMPYRIPAIVCTETESSENDIIAFADKRHGGGDVGQHEAGADGAVSSWIDLVCRRSSDNGQTWGEETTIVKGSDECGYGDAAVVADRENPKNILLMCAAGNVFFTKSSQSNPLRCFRFRSADGGISWTEGTEVTEDIYTLDSDYAAYFFSSGRICQSSKIKVGTHYRLYAALCTNKKGLFSSQSHTIVVYSDDFGDTWKLLGEQPAVNKGNEAKCLELSNGNVLVSSRKSGGRYYNVFSYTDPSTATGNWTGSCTVLSEADGGATNGEVLLVPAYDGNGNACNILLQSIPMESGRSKVGIYWTCLLTDNITEASVFEGSEWNSYPISSRPSAYSSMVLQADGNIGFVWEEELQEDLGTGGYDINYLRLSLSDITGGKYTTTASVVEPVDPTISLSAVATELTVGETTALILDTDSDGEVTYTSSNTDVATVSDQVVTAKAAGTVTITANVAATANYNAASATVTITVESNEGGNEGEETSTYEVTAVGGKIGSVSYYIATFSANKATIVPSGVEAYYVKESSSDAVTLARIASDKVIPAGQGVILISSTQTFTMTSTADESNAADLTGNLMVASLDGTIPSGTYVLAVKGSGKLAGQFAFCLTNSSLTLASGNRAYLQLTSNAPQLRMRIEEESTDIEELELTNDEVPAIHDLMGRRVAEMQPGRVYIVNGKKIVY